MATIKTIIKNITGGRGGDTFNGGGAGRGGSVVIRDGEIRRNGQVVKTGLSGVVRVVWEGAAANNSTDASVEVRGDVAGSISVGGSVTCGKVGGAMVAGGSVHVS